jgi:hypothetical protein
MGAASSNDEPFKAAVTAVFGERAQEFSPSLMALLKAFYQRARSDSAREIPAEFEVRLEHQEAKLKNVVARCASLLSQIHEAAESDRPVNEHMRRLLWEALDEFR